MNKFNFAIIAGLFSLTSVGPAFAVDIPTGVQCTDWFAKADTNKDDAIGMQEDSVKFDGMITKTAEKTSENDTIIPKEMFLEECAKGTFGMPT